MAVLNNSMRNLDELKEEKWCLLNGAHNWSETISIPHQRAEMERIQWKLGTTDKDRIRKAESGKLDSDCVTKRRKMESGVSIRLHYNEMQVENGVDETTNVECDAVMTPTSTLLLKNCISEGRKRKLKKKTQTLEQMNAE